MVLLFDRVRQALRDGRYVFSDHADERLGERGIPHWQAVDGSINGELRREYPKAKPRPKVEVLVTLPDGVGALTVWSWLDSAGVAKLVTIHFLDE